MRGKANTVSSTNTSTTKENKTMKKTNKPTVAQIFAAAITGASFVEIQYTNQNGEASTRRFLPLTPITLMSTGNHMVWGLDQVLEHENSERQERSDSSLIIEGVISAKLVNDKLDLPDGLYFVPSDMRFHLGQPTWRAQHSAIVPATVPFVAYRTVLDKGTGEKVVTEVTTERAINPLRDRGIIIARQQQGWSLLEVKDGKGTRLVLGSDSGKTALLPFAKTEAVYVTAAERRASRF
jgi:hypothetical protein